MILALSTTNSVMKRLNPTKDSHHLNQLFVIIVNEEVTQSLSVIHLI